MIDLKNKRILYIPIVSMRSYSNDLYDLTCDGNVNRFISFFLKDDLEYEHVDIVLPSGVTKQSLELLSEFEKCRPGKITCHYFDKYPIGGASVIRSYKGSKQLFDLIDESIIEKDYDVVIYEPNHLGVLIEGIKNIIVPFESVYWCPVSVTTESCPSFLLEYESIDKTLAKAADYLMVASINQFRFFKKVTKNVIREVLINPGLKLFDFKVNESILDLMDSYIQDGYKLVYFPFRLTDKGYMLDWVLEMIKKLSQEGSKICFVYSDPNNSDLLSMEENTENLVFLKIPTSRDVYYTMLSQVDCLVPYLENIDDIMHASLEELRYFNTRVLYVNNWTILFNRGFRISKDLSNAEVMFRNAINVKKEELIVLEGFDRIGKDTQLEFFKHTEYHPNELEVYIQKKDEKMPHYRQDPEGFVKWLKDYLKNQAEDLCKIDWSKRLIMTRLFVSDYVYSHLFDRPYVAGSVRRYLERHFTFRHIALLWDSYEDYLERIKKSGDELEYSKEEFDKIQQYYLDGLKSNQELGDIINVVYVKEKHTPHNIFDTLKKKIYG